MNKYLTKHYEILDSIKDSLKIRRSINATFILLFISIIDKYVDYGLHLLFQHTLLPKILIQNRHR
ncbi:hypothetical protein BpHYR1_028914 [Brachionus plicatilis]|uniref:Uncharacterized protein n=1 Tax=Brachionus plicatilis TaxID=10195 RepID=A0A3M7S1J8_BRAPC|nr:hypothetical protein BpHYR1_028914 [Brachionus plicatilis]